ncbi:MAG: M56 family metallopeptidase [Bacteroidetes bacterium]|nr:M56 family metallopeptidase [Bacteroidota bacterium]
MYTFIFYTLKSSLCLSAGFLFYYFLLKGETFHQFKRFIILGIIVISLGIPLLKFNRGPAGMTYPVRRLESILVKPVPVAVPEQTVVQKTVVRQEKQAVDLFRLVYLAGALLQILLILVSLGRILFLLGKSGKTTWRGIRIAVLPSDVVPLCIGWTILISEKDFREKGSQIILHEKTHLEKGHSLDLLLMELYLVMTWYNPFSWLMRHEMKQNHEFEADRNVLREGVDESDYQLMLVKAAAGAFRYKLANQFNQSNIKTRITMMNKTISRPPAILKSLLFLPLIALMLTVFAQKELIPAKPAVQNKTGKKYLVLPVEQLKLLGFEMNSTGLFYKNRRPGNPDYGTVCLYFTDKTYSASIILRPGEKINGRSAPEKILKSQATTKYDFSPMVVAWIRGNWTLGLSPKEEIAGKTLLPVQINMADLKMLKRTDTLVFWFRPTESLKQALSPLARMDDYLQPCPPDAGEPRAKEKTR